MRNKEPRNAFHEDKNKIVGGTLYLVATPIAVSFIVSMR